MGLKSFLNKSGLDKLTKLINNMICCSPASSKCLCTNCGITLLLKSKPPQNLTPLPDQLQGCLRRAGPGTAGPSEALGFHTSVPVSDRHPRAVHFFRIVLSWHPTRRATRAALASGGLAAVTECRAFCILKPGSA